MRVILVSAACLGLAACGSGDSGTIETEDGEVAYEIEQDGAQYSGTVTNADGEETTFETGRNANVQLPDGFSILPGAQVVTSTAVQSGEQGGTLVLLNTSASPDEVVAYYRGEAEAAGIEVNSVVASNGNQVIGGEGPDGLAFSLSASPTGDGSTTVQLSVGRGE